MSRGTTSDGVLLEMVYYVIWCTTLDGALHQMVYYIRWCTISDGVPKNTLCPGYNSTRNSCKSTLQSLVCSKIPKKRRFHFGKKIQIIQSKLVITRSLITNFVL